MYSILELLENPEAPNRLFETKKRLFILNG